MSFVEALASQDTSIEDAAALAPTHIKVIDLYIACLDIIPRNTVLTFLNRLNDVLRAPKAQTKSIDFSFMDLRGDDIRILEKFVTLPTVEFLDLRRGNFRLHTEQNFRMIRDVTSRPSSAMVCVFASLCNLPQELEGYPKLQCVEDTVDFDRLMQQHNAERKPALAASAAPSQPVRQSAPQAAPQKIAPQTSEEAKGAPKNLQDALRIFSRHRLTPVQMFEDPHSIDSYLKELHAAGRKDEWKEVVEACKFIHQVLPLSVVNWARKELANVRLEFSIYNTEKKDAYLEGLPADDADTPQKINRCIGVMRRHVGMVLKELKMNEAEAQVKMDGLRKRAEGYKSGSKYDKAVELEEVMALVVEWRPEFGFGAQNTDKEAQQKVDYQVVKRVR